MMKFQKRFVPLLLALVLALGTLPVQAAALTRGEAAQALLSAAPTPPRERTSGTTTTPPSTKAGWTAPTFPWACPSTVRSTA